MIAPSNVGPYYAKSAPREVTKEELKVIVKQFGEAALRFKKAGGDGVEIQAAHAHGLLGGFLTPLYNKRTDEYGGTLENRMRFTLECIEAIKKNVPDTMPVLVKFTPHQRVEGFRTIDEGIEMAKIL